MHLSWSFELTHVPIYTCSLKQYSLPQQIVNTVSTSSEDIVSVNLYYNIHNQDKASRVNTRHKNRSERWNYVLQITHAIYIKILQKEMNSLFSNGMFIFSTLNLQKQISKNIFICSEHLQLINKYMINNVFFHMTCSNNEHCIKPQLLCCRHCQKKIAFLLLISGKVDLHLVGKIVKGAEKIYRMEKVCGIVQTSTCVCWGFRHFRANAWLEGLRGTSTDCKMRPATYTKRWQHRFGEVQGFTDNPF